MKKFSVYAVSANGEVLDTAECKKKKVLSIATQMYQQWEEAKHINTNRNGKHKVLFTREEDCICQFNPTTKEKPLDFVAASNCCPVHTN